MISAGDILIAPPGLPDSRFSETVIYLWEHSLKGSAGVVLNRPSTNTIQEVCSDVVEHIGSHCLYWGGPVLPNIVFMLHSAEWSTVKTQIIDPQIAVTSDSEMFLRVSELQPMYWRAFFGHSGWAPGQLEGELRGQEPWRSEQSWLVWHEPPAEWLFECPEDDMWQSAIDHCRSQEVASWF
jgi:putative transcriptional regulator